MSQSPRRTKPSVPACTRSDLPGQLVLGPIKGIEGYTHQFSPSRNQHPYIRTSTPRRCHLPSCAAKPDTNFRLTIRSLTSHGGFARCLDASRLAAVGSNSHVPADIQRVSPALHIACPTALFSVHCSRAHLSNCQRFLYFHPRYTFGAGPILA